MYITDQLARAHIEQRLREARRIQPIDNPRRTRRVLRRATR